MTRKYSFKELRSETLKLERYRKSIIMALILLLITIGVIQLARVMVYYSNNFLILMLRLLIVLLITSPILHIIYDNLEELREFQLDSIKCNICKILLSKRGRKFNYIEFSSDVLRINMNLTDMDKSLNFHSIIEDIIKYEPRIISDIQIDVIIDYKDEHESTIMCVDTYTLNESELAKVNRDNIQDTNFHSIVEIVTHKI